MEKLCSYGCGNIGLFELKNGKVCCSDSRNKCPALRSKNSKGNIGRNQSEGTKSKISNGNKNKKKEKPKPIKNEEGLLCDYGCGNIATHQYKNGKLCCEDSQYRCPEQRKKNQERLLEQYRDPERIEKQRESILESWKDPERKNKNTIGLKRFYENEAKEEKEERIRKRKESSNTEEHKKVMSEAALEFWKREDYKINRAEAMEKLIEDPEYHENISKGLIKFNEENPDFHSKENNGNWKGGISFEIYPEEFNESLKEKIKKRDNYKCCDPDCSGESKKLNVHHIDYDKKNCNKNNLITLCSKCHGKTNGNRDYWKEFYKKIILEKENIVKNILVFYDEDFKKKEKNK